MPGLGQEVSLIHLQNVVFNRYLDSHLSESIQTWIRGKCMVLFDSMLGSGARGQNLVHFEH